MVAKESDQESSGEVLPRLIDHVEVELEALLGEARMTVAELSRLEKGAVIELDRKLCEAAEMRVNGRVIARGEVVTVNGKFAVRITEVG